MKAFINASGVIYLHAFVSCAFAGSPNNMSSYNGASKWNWFKAAAHRIRLPYQSDQDCILFTLTDVTEKVRRA